MKKAILIFASNCLMIACCFSQTWQWANHAGGTGVDLGISICIDTSGNSYVTGVIGNGPATFGSCGSIIGPGGQNIFVAKYNNNGNCAWIKQSTGGIMFGTGGYGIDIDDSANVYVTGLFTNSITFGTITLSGNGEEIFIVKYDQNGNLKWAKNAGGNGQDDGNSITVDSAGNSYVTGDFQGPAMFDSFSLQNNGTFIAKYNNAGQCVWVKSMGNSASGKSIKHDHSNGIYLTGSFSDTITVGSNTIISNGNSDVFITKYDTSGNCLWLKSFGSATDFDFGNAIGVDSLGNAYVTGSCGIPTYFSCDTINDYGFIAKYDASGNCVWAKQYPGGNGIYVDAQGNSYVTGGFNASTSIATCTLTGGGIFVIKYDANGNCVNAAQATSNSASGYSIVCNDHGNCYLTGVLSAPTTTFGAITLSITSNEIFVAKLSGIAGIPSGNARVSDFIIYPNPSGSSYTMEVSNDFLNSDMFIYDAMGSIIYQTKVIQENSQINIPSLSSGIYFVKLVTPNGISVQRSIVQQ